MADFKDRDDDVGGLIDRAVRELISESRQAVNQHPSVDQLLAFQQGQLADEAAEAVKTHLLACDDCAEELAGLEAFDHDHDPSFEPSEAQGQAAWQRFQAATAEPGGAEPGAAVQRAGEADAGTPPAPLPSLGWWPLGAVAASMLVVGALLGLWLAGAGLGGGGVEKGARQAGSDPHLVDLLSEEQLQLRSAAPRLVLEVPAEADPLIARLNLLDLTAFSGGYAAEALDSQGKKVWSKKDLRRQDTGTFLVTLPRDSFPSGTYRLRLLGLEAGEEHEIDIFPFELVRGPPG